MRYYTVAGLACLLFVIMSVTDRTGIAAAAVVFNPRESNISQLRVALESHRITYEQLVRFYLHRIARLDQAGPEIHALISLNADVLHQARELDRGQSSKHHGPLFGIPFIVKDNFNTAKLPTTGGSLSLQKVQPSTNAFIVQKLLEQGAILIAKANMSELASSYGRLGYSTVGGVTKNPYNEARNASGSSSGSAAAIAADFATFALGTDTSGSIRGPANVTGLTGLRPTLGLCSRSGIIPLALTFDTPGILSRSVVDVAQILDVIAAVDVDDAATLLQPPRHGSYASAIHPGALHGARLGVVANFRGGSEEIDAAELNALEMLKAQGAELIPILLPNEYENLWSTVMRQVSEAEFKPQLERYLRSLPETAPRSLAELIIRSTSSAVNPALISGLQEAVNTKLTDSPTYVNLVSQIIPLLRHQLAQLMLQQQLSALVFATMSCPASPRYDQPDSTYACKHDDPYRASYIASVTGFPEVTVPVARISRQLPMGLSMLGAPFSEAQLLSLAHALQLAVGSLPQPTLGLIPRIELAAGPG